MSREARSLYRLENGAPFLLLGAIGAAPVPFCGAYKAGRANQLGRAKRLIRDSAARCPQTRPLCHERLVSLAFRVAWGDPRLGEAGHLVPSSRDSHRERLYRDDEPS